MITNIDTTDEIREVVYSSLGGGIRGSIITTLYLIFMTISIEFKLKCIFKHTQKHFNRLTH